MRTGFWWTRPRPFSRPLWYPVAGGSAVVALLGGVAMTLLTLSGGQQARPVTGDCGLVTCRASLPPGVLGTAVPSAPGHGTAPARRHHRRAHQPALAPAVHWRTAPTHTARVPRPHRRHSQNGND